MRVGATAAIPVSLIRPAQSRRSEEEEEELVITPASQAALAAAAELQDQKPGARAQPIKATAVALADRMMFRHMSAAAAAGRAEQALQATMGSAVLDFFLRLPARLWVMQGAAVEGLGLVLSPMALPLKAVGEAPSLTESQRKLV